MYVVESLNGLIAISKIGESISQKLLEKIDHIEMLLLEINFKIDNFLGVEDFIKDRKPNISVLRQPL